MGKYKKKVKLYSEEDLDIAVRLVMNKNLSDRKAAKQFNIGRQIIRNRILEITGVRQAKIRGRKNMISSEQEIELGHIITEMAEAGFAVTPKQILSIVIEYAETNQIKNPYFSTTTSSTKAVSKYRIWRPTRRWLTRFIERNNLSRKRTKGMHIARFRNIRDPFLINNFYDLLGNWLSKLNLFNRPECIWNLDETGFPSDPNHTETVSKVGQKVVRVVAGTGRENTTVLAACNAAGEALPPLIVYSSKAAALDSMPSEWVGDKGIALPGTWYGLSKSGWMTSEVFSEWFSHFAAKTKENRPLLLLLDGHISHLSISTRQKAREENITILKLPSHTTSMLQPLDIAVFGPLKKYWSEQLNNWIASTGLPIRPMTKKMFVHNLSAIWFKGLSPKNIMSGFKSVGIFPFNPEKYDRSIFDHILLKQYEHWVALGKPKNISAEQVKGDTASTWQQQLPLMDVSGNPRKGKWIWIDEDENNQETGDSQGHQSSTQCLTSLTEIVSKRLTVTPTITNVGKKRINMNAAVITQEEVQVEIQQNSRVKPSAAPLKIKRKNTVSNTKAQESSDSSDSSDDDEVLYSDDDLSSLETDKMTPKIQPSQNDFVILQLIPEGRRKQKPLFYVGHIICSSGPRMWKVQCMRRYGDAINQFVFPDKEDCEIYLHDEIVKVLSSPKVARSVYHFVDDFTPYSSSLR